LIEEIDKRLALSKKDDIQLKLIDYLFSVDPEELPLHLQLAFLNFSFRQFTEISTEKAACETSTKVWTLKSTKVLSKLH
jgi:hypothetical protein